MNKPFLFTLLASIITTVTPAVVQSKKISSLTEKSKDLNVELQNEKEELKNLIDELHAKRVISASEFKLRSESKKAAKIKDYVSVVNGIYDMTKLAEKEALEKLKKLEDKSKELKEENQRLKSKS